jgi:APA family basic amino acid/polyamine antiporter
MIFGRVKPLDAILATAEKKSLKRSLGAIQLTLSVSAASSAPASSC